MIFNCRQGLESNVLRFVAYMATDNPIDKERKFIIAYFLSDDTVSVFEPPQRNSGRCSLFCVISCTMKQVIRLLCYVGHGLSI